MDKRTNLKNFRTPSVKPGSTATPTNLNKRTSQSVPAATTLNTPKIHHATVPNSMTSTIGPSRAPLIGQTTPNVREQPTLGPPQFAVQPQPPMVNPSGVFHYPQSSVGYSGSQHVPHTSTNAYTMSGQPYAGVAEYVFQRLLPTFNILADNQVSIFNNGTKMEAMLQTLTAEVTKSREESRWLTEKGKEREEKDKKDNERKSQELRAMGLMAQNMVEIRKDVSLVVEVLGKSDAYGTNKETGTTVIQRLKNLDMDVQEWLERARDPEANMPDTRTMSSDLGPARPSSSSSSLAGPSAVRHEMGTSPMKLTSAELRSPSSMTLKNDVNIQATPDDAQASRGTFDSSGYHCLSCSRRFSSAQTLVNDTGSADATLISDSADITKVVTVPSTFPNLKEKIALMEITTEINQDPQDPFWTRKVAALPLSNGGMDLDAPDAMPSSENLSTSDETSSTALHMQVDISQDAISAISPASRKRPRCEATETSPVRRSSRSKPPTGSTSFSPVDWSKAAANSSARAAPSSSSPSRLQLSTFSASTQTSPAKSYSLPLPPEGTIAALRQQALGDPYPFHAAAPSYEMSPFKTSGTAGAGAEAAERMLSPESQYEGDDSAEQASGDIDVMVEKASVPMAQSLSASIARRSTSIESALTSLSSRSFNPTPEEHGAEAIGLDGDNIVQVPTSDTSHNLPAMTSTPLSSKSPLTVLPLPYDQNGTSTGAAVAKSPSKFPASQSSVVSEEEESVRTLILGNVAPSSPATPQTRSILSQLLPDATRVDLFSPVIDRHLTTTGAVSQQSSISDIRAPQPGNALAVLREWRNSRAALPEKQQERQTEEPSSPLRGCSPVQVASSFSPPPLDQAYPDHDQSMILGESNEVTQSLPPSSPLFTSPGQPPVSYDDEAGTRDGSASPSNVASTPTRVNKTTTLDDTRAKTPISARNEKARRSPSIISISSDSDEEENMTRKPINKGKQAIRSASVAVKVESIMEAQLSLANPSMPLPTQTTRHAAPSVGVSDLLTRPLSPISEISTEGRFSLAPVSRRSEAASSKKGMQRLIASLEDDNADVVRVKKSRSVSAAASGLQAKTEQVAIASLAMEPSKKSLLIKKKANSAAITRIKRRNPATARIDEEIENEEDQPPLKRAKHRKASEERLSSSNRDSIRLKRAQLLQAVTEKKQSKSNSTAEEKLTRRSQNPVSPSAKRALRPRSPVKTPTKRQQPRIASVPWPRIENPDFDQFIGCDTCERWYHVGCVGLLPNDYRLSEGELYQCPACDVGAAAEGKLSTPRSPGKMVADKVCERPKCLQTVMKAKAIKQEVEQTFVIEAFVGVFKKSVGGRGIEIEYLVKWSGYDYDEATWEPAKGMGIANPGPLEEAFEAELESEGRELNVVNQAVLLKCASDAGWKGYGDFVKKN